MTFNTSEKQIVRGKKLWSIKIAPFNIIYILQEILIAQALIFPSFSAKNCTQDPVKAPNNDKGMYDWDPSIGNRSYSLQVNYW